jgi:hypothetical protein
MMAERGDFVAIHEPFCHLANYGHSEVAGHIVHTEEQVIVQLSAAAQVRPVFFKDVTPYSYPAVLADATFLRRCVHTFLIRDPRDVIASHYAKNPGMTRDHIGFTHLYTLYEAVRTATGTDPVVLDADDLVARPETVLPAWCARMGINHRPKSLNWAPGDRPEWSDAGGWHSEVRISTGLHSGSRRYPDTVENNPTLATYLDHHLPYYNDLWRRRVLD